MNIKRHIPNLITLMNLFCGCVAIVFVSDNKFEIAFYFVCLGIFFDFFDGFFARLFKVSGPLGLQLDSLADMITSGLVPGFVMFKMIKASSVLMYTGYFQYFPYLGFIITLGSCYRLAKFNIDERQSDSFIGLPTPANALFIMSLPLILEYYSRESLFILEIFINHWILLAITFCSAYILNAEIPLFSLKIKNFNLEGKALQVGFLLSALFLLLFFQYIAIPVIIIFYVLLSVINNKFFKK